MEQRRLYIGGLSDSVLEKDIKKKFSEFGTVKDVELRCKENYGNRRYFAYINIQAEKNSIDNCLHTCNNQEWKGGLLKVQVAKESSLQRVQNDISDRKPNPVESDTTKRRSKKQEAVKRKESSDESDDEPRSHLGVPAWRGFKANTEAQVTSPSTSKRESGETKKTPKDPPETATSGIRKRLYIGGLPETALDGDIKTKFAEFGSVKSVEIKCKENFGNKRFFAYIDIDTDEARLNRCIRECNDRVWQGAQLKVQIAKESFLQKAQNEIIERKNQGSDTRPGHRLRTTEGGDRAETAADQMQPMDYESSRDVAGDQEWQSYGQGDRREHFQQRTAREDHREPRFQDRSGAGSNKWDRSRPMDSSHAYNARASHYGHSRSGESSKRYGDDDTFESQRNGLFDGIEAADEIALEQDELLSGDEDEKPSQEDANDPLSEKNLKELFHQNSDTKGFTLSSLFADQLAVEEPLLSDDENEPSSERSRGRIENFEEEYWKRAERVDQRSWQDMVHKRDRNVFNSRTSSSFFILPGDQRLREGSAVFRTDENPAQFVDCWREQAEQLTLRLLQRKRNTRVQYQMAQRAAGVPNQASGKRKYLRKQIQQGTS